MFRTLKDGGGHAGGRTAGGSANSGMTMKQGWDGLEVGMPYPVSLPFEDKRLLAQVIQGSFNKGFWLFASNDARNRFRLLCFAFGGVRSSRGSLGL